MVFPTLFKPNAMIQCTSACLNATKHLLALMLPNICLAQRNQNSVRASNFMFFTWPTWDFRLEILKSEQLIHGSKIQDFRKLLSRNLGSMDPRSKISENSCPEILDSKIQDPRFQKTILQKTWIHGSKIQDPRFQKTLVQKSWIHGSMDPRFPYRTPTATPILEPG